MNSAPGRTISQVGGLLVLLSLILPWFEVGLGGIVSEGLGIWRFQKAAGIVLLAFALFAIAQVKLSSPETMATIYLAVSAAMVGILIYKIFIAPPGSVPLEVGGQKIDLKEVLEQAGIDFGPSYGAYIGLIGSGAVLFGSFVTWREGGPVSPAVAPQANWQQQAPQQQPASPQQRYVPPAPAGGQSYAPPAQQAVAPDPFAVPQQQMAAGGAAVPPDPFAPPTQQ